MKKDTFKAEVKPIAKVRSVCSSQRAEFLEFPSRIDNGIDGIIVLTNKNNHNIIGCIHVQCKGGDSYFKHNQTENFDYLSISEELANKYKGMAKEVAEPCILVWTSSDNISYWIDLKAEESYRITQNGKLKLIINKEQVFNKKFFKKLLEQVSKGYELLEIPQVRIRNESNNSHLFGESNFKKSSKNFYKSLQRKNLFIYLNERKQKIIFSRVGWNHITRSNRKISRIIQSMFLLSLIPDILKANHNNLRKVSCEKKYRNNESYLMEKYVLETQCVFNYRFPAIINIVFLRKKPLSSGGSDKFWFYSIYESSRNRELKMYKE